MPTLTLPVPDELWDAIDRAAAREERTRPAQVRYLLRQALAQAEPDEAPPQEERVPCA
jgi:hypothetical protein